jgi:hypothetical protein
MKNLGFGRNCHSAITPRGLCVAMFLRVCTLALAAMLAPVAVAQSPVPLAEVERIAALPEAEQERPANQKQLQAWFNYMVPRWVHALDGFAVGSLVHNGNSDTLRGQMSLQPGGRPDWRVIWRTMASGPTKEPDEPFYFPKGKVALYFESSDPTLQATAWHETQHGLLGRAPLLSRGNFISNYFDASSPEHLYLEAFAQKTCEWLLRLNRPLPDANFEAMVQEAAALENAYRAKGPITLDLEHTVWQKANQAWKKAAPKIKHVAGLPDSMRQEYRKLAGVEAPSVEEVVKFYMTGGVKQPNGVGIRVPKWVMVTDPMLAIVAIDEKTSAKKSALAGGILRQHFEVCPIYFDFRTQNPHAMRPPTLRGRLTLALETDDDDATLALALGNHTLPGIPGPGGPSLRRFQVDLSTLQSELAKGAYFHITFAHRHPERVSGKKTFKLSVKYEDPADALGIRVFDSSAAMFWVDVTGGPLPAATLAKAGGKSGNAGSTLAPASVRRMLDVSGFAWVSWDQVASFDGESKGNGWREWGTLGGSIQIPEGNSFAAKSNAGRYAVEVSGEITPDQVVWLKIKGVSLPAAAFKESFELEIRGLPVVQGQAGDYQALARPTESVIPRDVGRFVARADFERIFPNGSRQKLAAADWDHRTGPWRNLPDSPNAQASFLNVRVSWINQRNEPAGPPTLPAQPTISSTLRTEPPPPSAQPPNNDPPVPGEIVPIVKPPVDVQVTNAPLRVGRIWRVTEYHEDIWQAVWTLRGDLRTFDCVWTNQRTGGIYKGLARLVSVQGNRVTVSRDELKLTYTGVIGAAGNTIPRGTRNDFSGKQYWTAEW